jgi:xanthosine utilization system XapX-like protein
VGNKIKAVFSGARLLSFGAGLAVGIGLSLVPQVRAQMDKLLTSAGVVR